MAGRKASSNKPLVEVIFLIIKLIENRVEMPSFDLEL
jgi:hypothetical protein